MKDGLVRADTLPLVFRVPGTESLPRGTRVRARVTGIDLLTLDLHAQLLQRLDDAPGASRRQRRRRRRRRRASRRPADAGHRPGEADGAERLTRAPPWARPAPRALSRAPRDRRQAGPVAPAVGAAGVAGRARRPADLALRRSRALQPRVPRHAAGGHPGQRALDEPPTKAQAIAQANLAGGGNVEKGRAQSPLPAGHGRDRRRARGARRQIEQLQEQQQQLLAQIRRELALLATPDPQREAGRPQEREQEERKRQLLRLLAEIEKRINDENARPKKRYISPATQEEVYALYYDALKQRIEERGTRDFPSSRAASSTAS
jgi:hypothetical protein